MLRSLLLSLAAIACFAKFGLTGELAWSAAAAGWSIALFCLADAYRWRAFSLELHQRALRAIDGWQRQAEQLAQLASASRRDHSSSNATRDH